MYNGVKAMMAAEKAHGGGGVAPVAAPVAAAKNAEPI